MHWTWELGNGWWTGKGISIIQGTIMKRTHKAWCIFQTSCFLWENPGLWEGRNATENLRLGGLLRLCFCLLIEPGQRVSCLNPPPGLFPIPHVLKYVMNGLLSGLLKTYETSPLCIQMKKVHRVWVTLWNLEAQRENEFPKHSWHLECPIWISTCYWDKFSQRPWTQ